MRHKGVGLSIFPLNKKPTGATDVEKKKKTAEAHHLGPQSVMTNKGTLSQTEPRKNLRGGDAAPDVLSGDGPPRPVTLL